MQKFGRFLKPTETCEVVSSLKFIAFIMNAGRQIGFNSGGEITIRFDKIFKQSIHELILRGYSPGILSRKVGQPATNCKRTFFNGFRSRNMSSITSTVPKNPSGGS